MKGNIIVAEPIPGSENQSLDLSSLYLTVTERAPLPIATVEGATHIVRSVNPAFCRLIDKPAEQLVGKPFGELLPEKDECVLLLDGVFRTGNPESHTEQEHSKPHPVFWSYSMWPIIANGHPRGVMIQVTETAQFHERTVAMNEALMPGSVRQHELTEVAENSNEQLRAEIAERKQVEEALRESEERFRGLFNSTPMAVFVCDQNSIIQHYNRRAVELWGREPVLGVEQHCGSLKLYLPNGTVLPHTQSPIVEVLRTGIPEHNVEVLIERPDGTRLPVLVNFAALKNEAGEITGAIASFMDIAERKQADEVLRAAQAQLADRAGQLEGLVIERTSELTATNKQLEAFVYSIAHDLRAPLRAMQGFSTMLVEEAAADLNETGKSYADRINKSAQLMDALLSDLLAFSRISQQRVTLTSVDLKTIVESVLLRLQNDIQEKHAQMDSSGAWPVVLAHEPTLTQVLFNLASNALKFVRPGVPPQIRLRAEVVEASEGGSVQASARELAARDPRSILHAPPASTIRVWVEDNGPGIAPDYQEQIFRLFTRLNGEKYPGTGVGLAIVQKGIERMGGRVGVESASGQGSRFWFELKKV